MKAYKRSDISDIDVIRAYLEMEEGFVSDISPIQRLARDFNCPIKIAWRACERTLDKGFLEYGTSLRTAWVTSLGMRYWEASKADKLEG